MKMQLTPLVVWHSRLSGTYLLLVLLLLLLLLLLYIHYFESIFTASWNPLLKGSCPKREKSRILNYLLCAMITFNSFLIVFWSLGRYCLLYLLYLKGQMVIRLGVWILPSIHLTGEKRLTREKKRRVPGLRKVDLPPRAQTQDLSRCPRIIQRVTTDRWPACFRQLGGRVVRKPWPGYQRTSLCLQVLWGQQYMGCAPAVFMGPWAPHHSGSGWGKCPTEALGGSLLLFLLPSKLFYS